MNKPVKTGSMANDNIHRLKIVPIHKLEGTFHIPDYQRGYRWQRRQVAQLIEDIMHNPDGQSYYLQPITVIKRVDGGDKFYDLIDGQQRLTTLLLIYKALQQKAEEWATLNFLKKELVTEHYSICYDTRTESEEFIKDVATKSGDEASKFPDYLYMWHAYQKIKIWLDTHEAEECKSLANKLAKDVKVIWYEIGTCDENAWSIFANLNSGKIPLTNSELVKALFLSSSNNVEKIEDEETGERGYVGLAQYEKSAIVEQWDGIERELATPSFWKFISNEDMEKYPTKIDLLLDIVANKPDNNRDEYYTFVYFEKKYSYGKISHSEWQNIYDQYLKIKDWYEDNNLYHKIGYLIAIRYKSLSEIYAEGKDKSDSNFEKVLDKWITESITVKNGVTFESLDYNESADYELIKRLLTLTNVLSTLQLKGNTLRYPFDLHKDSERNRGGWSLEHIHAQKSEQIKKEGKRKWLDLHLKSLGRYESFCKNEYLKRMDQAQDNEEKNALEKRFRSISDSVSELRNRMNAALQTKELGNIQSIMVDFSKIVVPPFDEHSEQIYRDGLANMALLTKDDNAVLNNSSFDVKRYIILDEMSDRYIPPFTQKVFSKSFAGSDLEQLYFWSDNDRNSYLKQIKEILKEYLDNKQLPTEASSK